MIIKIEFEKLVNNLSDWIWAVDAEGRYTFCSDNVYDFLGYYVDEVVGKTPFDFMSEDEATRIQTIFLEHLKEYSPISRLKNTHIHKSGKSIVVETSGIPIFDINGDFLGYQGLDKDITEIEVKEKQYQKEIVQKSAFYESFKKAADVSSIVSKSDLSGVITYANENLCKICGYTQDELLGQPHNILRHPDTPKEVFTQMWKTIKAKKSWTGTLKNRKKDGSYYWVDISVSPILNEKNEIVEYIAIRHDITRMIDQQDTLENIATTDSLTGLQNRYSLRLNIEKSINPAIALIDIDNFSQINDFYGHDTGDGVIVELGKLLLNSLSNTRYKLFHLQGDEFVVLSQKTQYDIFTSIMQEITKNIPNIILEVNDENFSINITTALSFEKPKDLLATADMGLKRAKKSNQSFICYQKDISLSTEYKNNLEWTKKIKQSIHSSAFVPLFQPIVDNNTLKVDKYESLVRMKDENAKFISPFFFLEISKKAKLYPSIAQMMIQKSFEIFKDSSEKLSINLTSYDCTNSFMQEYIFTLLEKYQIGSRVIFEIVESESIDNFEKVSEFIECVKKYGCQIAIDDFGTGYSNFEYLLRLKADFIKIDGSMIKGIDTNKEAQLVVGTIVDFAKKIGMKTVAEFVENEAIFNTIKKLGVDYSQGYYFSAPIEKM